MNKLLKNVLTASLVATASTMLVFMLDVALAEFMQRAILGVYGGSAAVAELYLLLGELVACGGSAVVSVIVAKGQRARVLGFAVAGIAITVIAWFGVNYVIVGITYWSQIAQVNLADFWLVQAYAAAIAFPLGVTYYWSAVSLTNSILFLLLVRHYGAEDYKLKYRLRAVQIPKRKRRSSHAR